MDTLQLSRKNAVKIILDKPTCSSTTQALELPLSDHESAKEGVSMFYLYRFDLHFQTPEQYRWI